MYVFPTEQLDELEEYEYFIDANHEEGDAAPIYIPPRTYGWKN